MEARHFAGPLPHLILKHIQTLPVKDNIMSYAVFKDGDRISRPFQTEGDAWNCANDAGLVENVPSGDGAVQVLDSQCTIEPCDGELVMPANLA
jgi:hypothetical protein